MAQRVEFSTHPGREPLVRLNSPARDGRAPLFNYP